MKDYKCIKEKATKKIYDKEDKIAGKDPIRPEYHFHAPSQWMDDPNGIIWYKGYYHMMYSLNPDTDKYRAGMVYKTGSSIWKTSEPDWTGGITVWGHARSRDLIHWEHLPIALYPDTDNGEYYIWFGCTAINDDGIPLAIYTSIGYEDRNPTDSAIQHIQFADDDLIHWTVGDKHNPIMTETLHGGKKIWEWRDPFLFRQNGKTYLILGGKEDKAQGGKAAVLLYEAQNKEYTKWTYKGILFNYPDSKLRSCECPNIVHVGNKWVLFISPHGAVEYFVGDLNAENCSFIWTDRGIVDYSTHFYATNVIQDDKNRNLLWGAIEGFNETHGWNGINSLPREISLTADNKLIQKIPDEFKALRGEKKLVNGKAVFSKGTLELSVKTVTGAEGKISVGENTIEIRKDEVIVENHTIPFDNRSAHEILCYVDKSVMELFIDSGEGFTAMLVPAVANVEVTCNGIGISAEVYTLNTEGLFSRYND